jgi:glycosyltransferase involved in cell wall biosynthesis
MKVLLLHNFYQQPGGEDQVFKHESALLKEYGHQVVQFSVHNNQIDALSRVQLTTSTIWNRSVYSDLRELIRSERPQIAHFHNTFPLISPAAYYAAKDENIPVVQTLHNYRLFCPSGVFFRDGRICEDCLGKFTSWPGIIHSCYRGNSAATSVVALMLSIHRLLSTWISKVDVYIALTTFARQKFIEGGLPASKIVVKPNFIHPIPKIENTQGIYALFVGRLVQEKGIRILLNAWRKIGAQIPLKIVGDGPLASEVSVMAKEHSSIEWFRSQSHDAISSLMKSALTLIIPSLWYEGFPMVVAEAYAEGLPVIASSLGSLSGLVVHGRTGRHFKPGDSEDLCVQVEWILNHREEHSQMRKEARKEFELKYTAEQNYTMLMEIYEKAGVRNVGSL